jgi:hypothetical protein
MAKKTCNKRKSKRGEAAGEKPLTPELTDAIVKHFLAPIAQYSGRPPRNKREAATTTGETWDEWTQRQLRGEMVLPRVSEKENILARVDRRLARIDRRLAETATAPPPNPSADVPLKSGKEWVSEVFERRRDELLAIGITDAGRLLASQTPPDGKPVKRRWAEKIMRDCGYPKAFRGSPKQRPK